MTQPSGYVHGYTVLLFVYGFFLVMAAVMMHSLAAQETEGAFGMRLAGNIQAILAVGCLVVALLRSRGSPLARPTTAAISIVLAISFPFGTAAFFWWLLSVRQQERPESDQRCGVEERRGPGPG
jgi:hypothetical protein